MICIHDEYIDISRHFTELQLLMLEHGTLTLLAYLYVHGSMCNRDYRDNLGYLPKHRHQPSIQYNATTVIEEEEEENLFHQTNTT